MVDMNGGVAGSKMAPIFRHADIAAFNVDHSNFRVLVFLAQNKSIVSVSLCGSERNTIRRVNHHQNVTSMLFLGELFCWIDQGTWVVEDMNKEQVGNAQFIYPQDHYENLPLASYTSMTQLVAYFKRSQPIPVPAAAVKNLRALFSADSVNIEWDPPPNIAPRGKATNI